MEEEAEFAIFESERNEHGIRIGNDREMVSHSVGDTVSAELDHFVTTSWCDENDVETTCWKNQVFWKKYLLTPMASAYSQSVSASAASNEQTWRIYI